MASLGEVTALPQIPIYDSGVEGKKRQRERGTREERREGREATQGMGGEREFHQVN